MLDFQKVKLKVSLLSFDSAQDEYLFFFLVTFLKIQWYGNSELFAVVANFIETIYHKWL